MLVEFGGLSQVDEQFANHKSYAKCLLTYVINVNFMYRLLN